MPSFPLFLEKPLLLKCLISFEIEILKPASELKAKIDSACQKNEAFKSQALTRVTLCVALLSWGLGVVERNTVAPSKSSAVLFSTLFSLFNNWKELLVCLTIRTSNTSKHLLSTYIFSCKHNLNKRASSMWLFALEIIFSTRQCPVLVIMTFIDRLLERIFPFFTPITCFLLNLQSTTIELLCPKLKSRWSVCQIQLTFLDRSVYNFAQVPHDSGVFSLYTLTPFASSDLNTVSQLAAVFPLPWLHIYVCLYITQMDKLLPILCLLITYGTQQLPPRPHVSVGGLHHSLQWLRHACSVRYTTSLFLMNI